MNWTTVFPESYAALRPIATAFSLTQTLSQYGQFSVQLNCLGETTDVVDFADFRLPDTLWVRDVTLWLDTYPVVHAQSFCAPESVWYDVLHCGTTPLGAILFSGNLNDLQRSPIEYKQPENAVLARRSWFDWQGERLYLVEYFLPDIELFLND